MIFISNNFEIININKTSYTRDKDFYQELHFKIFNRYLKEPSFTKQIINTINQHK